MRILFVLLLLANLALFAAGQGYFGPPPADRGRDPERLLMELHPETIHVPNDLGRQETVNPPAPIPPRPHTALVAEPVAEPSLALSEALPAESAPANAAAPALPIPTPAVVEPAPQPASPQPTPAVAADPVAVLPAPSPAPVTPPPAVKETVCRELGSFTESESKLARQWVQKNGSGVTVQVITEAGPSSWMVLVPPATNLAAAQKTAAALNKQGIKDLFVIQEAGPNQYAVSLGVFSQEKSARTFAQSLKAKAGRNLNVVHRPGSARYWLQFPTLEASQQTQLRQQALKQYKREWRACSTR